MTSIGETLRRERFRRNLDLENISRELRISSKFLEAMEADDFARLPGGMFTKSFVRQYARYLGLDEEEFAAEIQRMIEPPPPITELMESQAAPPEDIHVPRVQAWEAGGARNAWSSSLPSLALVVVAMMVCSLIYSWWLRSRSPAVPLKEQTPATLQTAQAPVPPPMPVESAVPVPTAPQETAGPVEQPAATSQPVEEPAPKPAPQSAQPALVRQPPVPAAQRGALPSATTPARMAAEPSGPVPANPVSLPTPSRTSQASRARVVRVQVSAAEPVWVLAQTDGKYEFSGTLDANQSRTIEAASTVVLRLGNAGGVSITLNGKPIGSVGPRGQVRTIQLTSGGWTVAAPKPSLALDDPL